MAMNISAYFESAQLSLAAYALNLTRGMTPNQYRAALEDAGMASRQAQEFAATYSIVDQYTDPSGFSATVFKKGSETFFAIRGTEFSFPDIYNSDLGDFLSDGGIFAGSVAADQVVAMYNYYQRLLAPANGSAAQLTKIVGDSGISLRLDTVSGIGLGNAADITQPLTVSGHSLGGYLGIAFGRLFDSSVGQLYTYNAPGFNAAAADTFFAEVNRALGVSGSSAFLGDARSTNLYAADGFSVAAGYATTYGLDRPLFIEKASLIENHFLPRLADSLALYDVFATIAPNASIEEITSILGAASYTANTSLENVLDDLRRVFSGNSDTAATVTDIREQFYNNLAQLKTEINSSGLSNLNLTSLRDESSSDIINAFRTDIAYRHAVVELQPFVLEGADSLYNALNTNDYLNPDNYTDEYVNDRVSFLGNLLLAGSRDNPRLSKSGEDYEMTDKETGQRLYFLGDVPDPDLRAKPGHCQVATAMTF